MKTTQPKLYLFRGMLGACFPVIFWNFCWWLFSLGVSFTDILVFIAETLPAPIAIGIFTAYLNRIWGKDRWDYPFLFAFFGTFWAFPISTFIGITINVILINIEDIVSRRLIFNLTLAIIGILLQVVLFLLYRSMQRAVSAIQKRHSN